VLRHAVVFRWKEGTTDAQVAAVVSALRELPAHIPELRSYHFGPDLGLADGNGDFAVVADVDDAVSSTKPTCWPAVTAEVTSTVIHWAAPHAGILATTAPGAGALFQFSVDSNHAVDVERTLTAVVDLVFA